MAHKKGQGSSRNGRDSNPSYLGLKVADGQTISAGTIILKQRGTKVHPGENVGVYCEKIHLNLLMHHIVNAVTVLSYTLM